MERISSNKAPPALTPGHRQTLLKVAADSIAHGLTRDRALGVTPSDFAAELQALRACFVTLTIEDALRGCIGTLEARRPLVQDIAHNAYAAAFRDPRFTPLRPLESERLHIHISVLSLPEPLSFGTEDELLAQLTPGVDGLILEEGGKHGTFLPSVWESLPDPRDFIAHLKHKAGLSPDYWSNTLRVKRYTAESFP